MDQNNYKFFICNKELDQEILNLLEENPMGERIELIHTTRPSFFRAQELLQKRYIVIGCRNETGELAAFASIAVQARYINGKVLRCGYLSGLRISKNYQGKGITSMGFSFLKSIKDSIGVNIFFSSIVADNKKAIHILTKQRKDYPFFTSCGRIVTRLLFPKKIKNKNFMYHIAPLEKNDYGLVIHFLQNIGRDKNFFPYHMSLFNQGLKEDNYIIAKKNDAITGVLALWDQSSFKQVIIHKVGFPYNILFSFYNNIYAKYENLPLLPEKKGAKLPFVFLSHVTIQDNNPEIFLQMLYFIMHHNLLKENFLVAGFDIRDPLLGTARRFNGIEYKTNLYFVSWDKEAPELQFVKKNIFYPEIALL